MGFINILMLFGLCIINIQASTHWMVTETGLIQPKIDSPFEMARPYDLLAFLNQDTRWDNIFNIYNDLLKRQGLVDTLWTDLEQIIDFNNLRNSDEYCIKVDDDLNAIDWYITFPEDGTFKGIKEEEFLFSSNNYGDTDVPDCKKISSLTFSMLAFEHLEGMIQRENLTAAAEITLPQQISPIMSVDQFGHWVTAVLRKNSSSWLHYNLASIYWRVRGNAPKAMECSRRAVHYAPREYKNVALLSLGSILHRSKMTEDATIVLGAASDHDPQCPMAHFTLGSAYGILGDFNSSVKHYEQSLKLSRSFFFAEKYKNGVMCCATLLTKLETVKDIINKLREQLVEYSQKEIYWIKSQAAFLRTMKHAEEYDYRNVEKHCEKMSEITGLNIKDLKKRGDQNTLIQYFLEGPMYKEQWLSEKGVVAIEAAYDLHRYVHHIGKHINKTPFKAIDIFGENAKYEGNNGTILKEIGPMPAFPEMFPDVKDKPNVELQDVKTESQKPTESKPSSQDSNNDIESGNVLYPSSIKINRNKEDFDKDSEWPSNRLCKEAAPNFPESVEAIYSVFMPFENKGLKITALLTDRIGFPASVEHDLPWHPPICPQDKDITAFTQKKSQKPQILTEVVATDHLKDKLLEYVGDGNIDAVKHMQDAEVGQRIYAAMQMKLAPKWLLYTLSSLYWRVRGNNINALNCLLTANKKVESRFRDVVLASLASVYLEMGYFDESLAAAEEAFRLNMYEPVTNFLLSELNMLKKHRNTHMFHLKQVLRVDPNFMGGVARNLLNGWACILKQVNAFQELEFGEGDICTQVEPGMSMVCDRDGTNCHVTNIQCFSSHERESSTIVRLLEIKDDNAKGSRVDRIDDTVFDEFISNMPTERSDKTSHQKNYYEMMRSINNFLQDCIGNECWSVQAKNLALKEEDCTHQYLQLSYWLQMISFRQLVTDSDLRLPSEITTMAPSNKKVPECRLPVDPSEDFFLQKLASVDSDGWEPVLSLMHQFAELNFNFVDYVTLGAKIAKYVEARPSSWVGLLAAGWWCGAGGRGACAVRCLAAAHAHAPPQHAVHAFTALSALLHMQSKHQDAKNVAYLSFYSSPKSKIEAFLVAVSHTFSAEYEQAIWMYRYALKFDDTFLPAKACLHATMCLLFFGENSQSRPKHN
ncbi:hypothetical protein K1T71_005228 [Dendrolimus kikuchii]|uniref:Uncharacterized protein n=1 Tax=Dendrolimus kikuchii TaxID=765133 RepID=A0ACC1D6K9_9NEOP|nr:hypothetical protein K1T71_005228 [Dendrolimus kikuchii]